MQPRLYNSNEVILVDDNPPDRQIAKICYSRSGLPNPWLEFASGQDFLSYLDEVEVGERPFPALVLLDINMPCMTGFEVLTSVRRHPAFKNLPMLVMLTGSRNEIDIEKSKKCGADGYFMKPTELDDYISFFQAFKTGDFSHCA